MGDFFHCLADKGLNSTIFGEKLAGEGINVEWISSTTALGYYTLLCLLVMVVTLVGGEWKWQDSKKSHVRKALGLWQVSILVFAMITVVTGTTRFSIVLGVLHNAAEVYSCWALANSVFSIQRKWSITWAVIAAVWLVIELVGGVASPLLQGFYFLAVMGAFIDFTTWIFWILGAARKKISPFPAIAFSFHIVYLMFLFFNCFFRPWGRIIGLGLNTLAVAFASLSTTQKERDIWNEEKMTRSWKKRVNQKVFTKPQDITDFYANLTEEVPSLVTIEEGDSEGSGSEMSQENEESEARVEEQERSVELESFKEHKM